MSKKSANRLGEILVGKKLLTTAQLDIALAEQASRRLRLEKDPHAQLGSSSLGEILVELGFINRLALNRGLNWQAIVRKLAIAMSFCAPLMVASEAAVAASSAASVASSSRSSSSAASSSSKVADVTAPTAIAKISLQSFLWDRVALSWTPATDNVAVTSYRVYRDNVLIATVSGSQPNYTDFSVAPLKQYLYGVSAGDAAGNWSKIVSLLVQTAAKPANAVSSSSVKSSASSKASAAAAGMSSAASSVRSSASMSSQASVPPSKPPIYVSATTKISKVSGSAAFKWSIPARRENGKVLAITELAGYEFRYRLASEPNFSYMSFDDPKHNFNNLSNLAGDYIFQVAAYDKTGLYSTFVDVVPLAGAPVVVASATR